MNPPLDNLSLTDWFEEEKRDFPWRKNLDPYRVWISEVMLQQTQAGTVIPYFEKWMQRFPTVQDLAHASLDDVIKHWEGLGYYSRARNLLEGAKTICNRFDGKIPESENDLGEIKGLGPYTIGAIRSFAFHQKAAAVDGNVLRVITRYFQITDDISKNQTVKKIRQKVESCLPEDRHWVVNEALIELGATLCTKKPKCSLCPLKNGCLSFRNGMTQEIPFKSASYKSIPLYRQAAVIYFDNHFLIRRGLPGKIMEDLHEFPYFETPDGLSKEDLQRKIAEELGVNAQFEKSLETISHSFTKYRVRLVPELFGAKCKMPVEGYMWIPLEELYKKAFSSGHRRILKALSNKQSRPFRP